MKSSKKLARQIVADDFALYLEDFTDEEMEQIGVIIWKVIQRSEEYEVDM